MNQQKIKIFIMLTVNERQQIVVDASNIEVGFIDFMVMDLKQAKTTKSKTQSFRDKIDNLTIFKYVC